MKKILLIDDERVLNESISEVIEALGYQVESCFSIDEAMNGMDFSSLDLIICDVGLPGECAFTFVQWVKQKHQHLTIVMLSAFNEQEKIEKALKVGADRYLVKPPELTELREVLDSLEQ